MSLEKIRDIIFIVCAVVFVIVYSISNLIPIFFSSWYVDQTTSGYPSFSQDFPPSVFADCQTKNNIHTLLITLSNTGQKDLKDVKCNLVDKSGLISTEDSQTISSLGLQSTDICTFKLEGVYEKPLKFEVIYGDQSIKQVVQCYPNFS